MYFAQIAIANMHQLMLQAEGGTDTKLVEAPKVEPMIALAVGKKAATYYADNIAAGEEQLKASFGDDLGLTGEFFRGGGCGFDGNANELTF
jgi:hypothetical protein